MKTHILRQLLTGIVLALTATLCYAESVPALTNVRGAEYPQIHPDLRVTFRLKAPNAQKVQIQLGKRYDLMKGADSAWTVTTQTLVPGFHY